MLSIFSENRSLVANGCEKTQLSDFDLVKNGSLRITFGAHKLCKLIQEKD